MQGAGLSSDQRTLLETTRRFGERVVAPVPPNSIAMLIPRIVSRGTLSNRPTPPALGLPPSPEEYGGAGIDSLTTAMIIEELGRFDVGVSVVLAQTLKIAQTLQAAATPGQRERFIPDYASDPRGLLAIGLPSRIARRTTSFLMLMVTFERRHFAAMGAGSSTVRNTSSPTETVPAFIWSLPRRTQVRA